MVIWKLTKQRINMQMETW